MPEEWVLGDKANSLQDFLVCMSELTMKSNSVFNHGSVLVLVLMFLFVLLNSLKQLRNTSLCCRHHLSGVRDVDVDH